MTPKMRKILKLLNGEGCGVFKGARLTCRQIGQELSPKISQEGRWARDTLARMYSKGWVSIEHNSFSITATGERALRGDA